MMMMTLMPTKMMTCIAVRCKCTQRHRRRLEINLKSGAQLEKYKMHPAEILCMVIRHKYVSQNIFPKQCLSLHEVHCLFEPKLTSMLIYNCSEIYHMGILIEFSLPAQAYIH